MAGLTCSVAGCGRKCSHIDPSYVSKQCYTCIAIGLLRLFVFFPRESVPALFTHHYHHHRHDDYYVKDVGSARYYALHSTSGSISTTSPHIPSLFPTHNRVSEAQLANGAACGGRILWWYCFVFLLWQKNIWYMMLHDVAKCIMCMVCWVLQEQWMHE